MKDLILQSMKAILKKYPEIKGYLTGKAAEIAENGVEQYEKIPPVVGYVSRDEDWDDWEVTPDDIDRAVTAWNKAMPEYAGILDADVEIDPTKTVNDA